MEENAERRDYALDQRSRGVFTTALHDASTNRLTLIQPQVSGSILYPGAGMLIMAIEAVKQIQPPTTTRQVSGFYFQEANFINPIIVGKTWDECTEVMVDLRPLQRGYEKECTGPRSESSVYTRTGGPIASTR